MKKEITEQDSILLQSLANVSLLAELSNNDFLNSSYFHELKFKNKYFKEILILSGIGNPAMMQMMLYSLLVVVKEILSGEVNHDLDQDISRINKLMAELTEEDTYSTYNKESKKKDINYFKHIRNAVAHSNCKYITENQKNYVIFFDKYNKKECIIKIECNKVGILLEELQKLIIRWCDYNMKSN